MEARMFKDNKNFYPTPKKLIDKMIAKIQGHPQYILEPSAGKGDLIEGIKAHVSSGARHYCRPFEHAKFAAIEVDPDLQATLRGKHLKVIDSDFLAYAGQDKFDAIIMNPPFDNGDLHLLKAIEVMYRGQIVCLLNAETIRNPDTKTRKALLRKLDELGAKIEYIKNAFKDAERTTGVEVALIYIKIDRKVEDDLFADCKDKAQKATAKIKGKQEVSTGKTIAEMVAEYNEIIRLGTETIVGYYRNYNKVGKYLAMFDAEAKSHYRREDDDLTTKLQDSVNELLVSVRKDFWRRVLNLEEVNSRMTSAKQKEFEHQLTERCHMDFTESNIRQFVLNIIGGYEQTMIDAVIDIFDMFTIRHCYHGEAHEKNIHYFNGWKTNNAFKVGKKVVIPIYGSYDGAFFRDAKFSWGRWDLNYAAAATLGDIDKVMAYFDGMQGYFSISNAITRAFGDGKHNVQTSGIESTYFKITVFKKNTIHLTFRNEDVLRRFNLVACRGKGWLPQDYGVKPYAQLTHEEKLVADAFDGKEIYDKKVGQELFKTTGPQLRLAA
jgi:hypothetical protein